jgi:hypothetical protein
MTQHTGTSEVNKKTCSCGRSSTGFCTGLHRLSDQEWDDLVLEKPIDAPSHDDLSNSYSLKVQLDSETGDYFIELPDALLAQVGWQTGDELEWKDLGDQRWQLTKLTKTLS